MCEVYFHFSPSSLTTNMGTTPGSVPRVVSTLIPDWQTPCPEERVIQSYHWAAGPRSLKPYMGFHAECCHVAPLYIAARWLLQSTAALVCTQQQVVICFLLHNTGLICLQTCSSMPATFALPYSCLRVGPSKFSQTLEALFLCWNIG